MSTATTRTFHSRSFVSFLSMIAALGSGALLLAACKPTTGFGTPCCCVTNAGSQTCTPAPGGQAACPNGVVQPCPTVGVGVGFGGGGPGSRKVRPDGGTR